MPQETSERLIRVARQVLETDRLLGVEFVPRRTARSQDAGHAAVTHVLTETKPLAASTSVAPEIDMSETSPEPVHVAAELPASDKAAALEALRAEHDASCPHCTNVTYHTQTVFGEGHFDAGLMFVGEAPGANEDRTGRPFVGRAGQKLDEMIKSIGMAREDVYIANILKSRPPENRTPLRPEVDACSPYLVRQIEIIRPAVIMTLGGPATKLLLETDIGITRLRGQWATFDAGGFEVPVMPTFHPAYLLRNYTRDTRLKVWSDLQAVMERLG